GGGQDPLDGLLLAQPLGQQQRHRSGDVGGGHRRAGQVAVGVLLPLFPDRRVDVVGLGLGVAPAGGQDGPLGVAGGARVVGDLVVVAGGPDDERVHVPVLRAADAGAEQVVVARGDDRHRAVLPGVLHALGELGAHGGGDHEHGAAEAQVDDLGAVVDDPLDAGDDVGLVGGGALEDLGHDQPGVGGDPGDALPVVLHGGDDPGDVGAVAEVVLGRAGALQGVAVGVEAARRLDDLAGEVLVAEVDAGVDDADLHAGARRLGPGGRGADGLEAPLPVELGVVAGLGRRRGGGHQGEPGENGDDTTPAGWHHLRPLGSGSAAGGLVVGSPGPPTSDKTPVP